MSEQASKQIKQMCQFILMEAKEKANEIRMKAKQEAQLSQQKHVIDEKQKRKLLISTCVGFFAA